jgi:hypothetical protein
MLKRPIRAWKRFVRPYEYRKEWREKESKTLNVFLLFSGLYFGYFLAKKYSEK